MVFFCSGGSKDFIGDNIRSDSQVRVNRVPVYIPTPVPQDMKALRFNHVEEVQFAAIPAHQLNTVIKAYQHASGEKHFLTFSVYHLEKGKK